MVNSIRRFVAVLLAAIFFCLSIKAKEIERPAPDSLTADQSLLRYAGNIHRFCHIFPQEKVYVQFDNTSYYTGETIWFKAYVVEASTHHRAPSGVLYVDLLSPNGELLKQQKLKIVAGQADGSFPLMDGSTAYANGLRGTVLPYPSGFYEIRAYTSNMLNFNEQTIFSRVLPVFEKPEKDGNYYGESPTIRIRWSDVGDPSDMRPKPQKLKDLNADFLPEGGSLVLGLPCRVAFRLSGSDGLPVSAEGLLNGTVPVRVDHDGMGSFVFTPDRKSNSVRFEYGGSSYRFALPDADESGFTLYAQQCSDTLAVDMRCTPDIMSDTLGLTVTCRGELCHFGTFAMRDCIYRAGIPLAGFPEGVCQLTVFDRYGVVYGRRTFYHSIGSRLPSLTMTVLDDTGFAPFAHVRLGFDLKDGAGNSFRDRFCLSVRDTRLIGTASGGDDLRTSLLLLSDLKGLVYAPEYYFESDDSLHRRHLDLLMMVQGWERYDWRMMAGLEPYAERHRMEKGLSLNGWIISPFSNKPLSDVKVLAATMPKDKSLTERFTYVTDSTGYFGFDVSDFYDNARLTIQAKLPKRLIGTSGRIRLERSMTPRLRPYRSDETVFSYLHRPIDSSAIRKSRRDIVLEQKKADVKPEENDSLPKVILEAGILLPEVEIDEARKYIDYFTFTSFDVRKDRERDLDSGEYSTDVQSYLNGKELKLMLTAYDKFYYVHDSKRFYGGGYYAGGYSNDRNAIVPVKADTQIWAPFIDLMDIKSIMVYDKPVYMRDVIEKLCPLYKKWMNSTLVNMMDFETGINAMTGDVVSDIKGLQRFNTTSVLEMRVMLIDIELYDEDMRTSRRNQLDLSRRISVLNGFSSPYRFYSPEYPDGPIIGDVDYRRTLYWNPNVVTDADGHAEVEFYNNSYSTHFNVIGAGITAGGTPYVLDAEY